MSPTFAFVTFVVHQCNFIPSFIYVSSIVAREQKLRTYFAVKKTNRKMMILNDLEVKVI